jgi:ArsR family metal-binding transcriptional regulator
MITFFPSGKIAVTNTKNEGEAKEILERIKGIINEAYADYLKFGKPSKEEIEAAEKVSWMDIYAYLPKTNCGKCGYQICSAFAASLLQGETKLSNCTPLKEPKHLESLKTLEKNYGKRVLCALGWNNPESLLGI